MIQTIHTVKHKTTKARHRFGDAAWQRKVKSGAAAAYTYVSAERVDMSTGTAIGKNGKPIPQRKNVNTVARPRARNTKPKTSSAPPRCIPCGG